MEHRDLVGVGEIKIQSGRGRPTKNGFKKAPGFVRAGTQEQYVEVPDPVTTLPIVISLDGARLFQSEYAHPEFAPELEEALEEYAFVEGTFWDLPEDEQVTHVQAFLKAMVRFGEERGFND